MVLMSSQSVLTQKLLLLIGSGIAMGFFATSAHATPTVFGYVMEVQMTPAVCLFDNQGSKNGNVWKAIHSILQACTLKLQHESVQTKSSAVLSPLQN